MPPDDDLSYDLRRLEMINSALLRRANESKRLRDLFASKTGTGQGKPTLPDACVFTSYKIYSQVYQGYDGYLQSLRDLYGIDGNLHTLLKITLMNTMGRLKAMRRC